MLTVSLPSESDNLMVKNFWRKEMFLQLYPPGGFRKLRQGESSPAEMNSDWMRKCGSGL